MSQPRKTLRIGLVNPLVNIDPATCHDVESNFVLRQIAEAPFTAVMGDTHVEPCLAEAPEAIDGRSGSGLRFRVREGSRFADGRPVTIEDVAHSLSEAATVAREAEVAIVDEYVELRTRSGDRQLDLLLADTQCSVVKRSDGGFVGCGPWMITSSTPTSWILDRNPYHPEPPPIDRIRFDIYPSDSDGRPTALLDAINQGGVDLSLVVPRDDVGSLVGMRKAIWSSLGTGILFMQTQRPALASPRVRRAIARSIDRYEIAKVCHTNPLAFMAQSPLPRALGEQEDDGLGFDLEEARRLFNELGSARPTRLSMNVVWGPRPYLPNPIAVAEAIRDQLARVGIALEIRPTTDSETFFRRIVERRDHLVLGGWVADTPDPSDYLEAILASDRGTSLDDSALNANHGSFESVSMDSALADFRRRRDRESLDQLMACLADEAPIVPLFYGNSTMVWSFRVEGLKQSPLPLFPLTDIDLIV